MGLAFALTRSGSRPAFVLIITAPEVRSPYSTEGIPRTICIDSIFSVEILRTSVPPAGEAPQANEAGVSVPLNTVGLIADRLALFEMGAPSRIIAVPIAFIGASGPLELET